MKDLTSTEVTEAIAEAGKLGTILRRCFAAWITRDTAINEGNEEHVEAARKMDAFLGSGE